MIGDSHGVETRNEINKIQDDGVWGRESMWELGGSSTVRRWKGGRQEQPKYMILRTMVDDVQREKEDEDETIHRHIWKERVGGKSCVV